MSLCAFQYLDQLLYSTQPFLGLTFAKKGHIDMAAQVILNSRAFYSRCLMVNEALVDFSL